MIHLSATVDCPYCATRNNFLIEHLGRRIVTCDLVQGGCDNEFLLAPRVECTANAEAIGSVACVYAALGEQQ